MRSDLRDRLTPFRRMLEAIEHYEKCASTQMMAAGGFGLTREERDQFIAWSHENTAHAEEMTELFLSKLVKP